MRAKSISIVFSLLVAACASNTSNEQPKAPEPVAIDQHSQDAVNTAMDNFKRVHPNAQQLIDQSYGYVVFPAVGEGGFLVGAAHGTGWVYEQGKLVGQAKINQIKGGALVGGKSYEEVIFFRDKNALDMFKAGKTKLGAQASATAMQDRTGVSAGYNADGLAVFVMSNGGLMAQASVGGQKFSFRPIG